jgi:hypothetical protein
VSHLESKEGDCRHEPGIFDKGINQKPSEAA